MLRYRDYDYELARSLIPYIRPLQRNCPQWPEAYCDVTSATIYGRVPGWKYQCGTVEGTNHIWLKKGHLNVDFTATQFTSLNNALHWVDGYPCIYGTDEYLMSIGYNIKHWTECRDAITNAGMEIAIGDHGNVNPQGWCRENF